MGRPSFSRAASGGSHKQPTTILHELQATDAQLQRLTVQQNRLQLDRNRDDKREWVQDRRTRTRHLIELGGLVQKAGLVKLLEDDRATLLGALLDLAGRLQGQGHAEADPVSLKIRWRRHGMRVFEADAIQQAGSVDV